MMKRLGSKEILASADRMNFSRSAKAAQVLREAEKFLEKHIGSDFFWKPKYWKNGTLQILTEHSAGSQKIFSKSENLLEHLKAIFPEYYFREIRTEITTMRFVKFVKNENPSAVKNIGLLKKSVQFPDSCIKKYNLP